MCVLGFTPQMLDGQLVVGINYCFVILQIPKVYTLDTKALTHILASRDFERSEALRYRLGQLLGQGTVFSLWSGPRHFA